MARMNGISTFTSSEVRTFDAYLSNLSSPFKLYEKIKEYFLEHSSYLSHSKNLFQIRISKQDIYDIESSNYSSEMVISGIITDDKLNTLNTLNDNDVFEKIYSFLEFLFV
jgi:hypothetical protein